jgi:hypothetical protein
MPISGVVVRGPSLEAAGHEFELSWWRLFFLFSFSVFLLIVGILGP